MKKLLFPLFIIFSISVYSQSYYYNGEDGIPFQYYYRYNNLTEQDSIAKANGIEAYKEYYLNSQGEKVLSKVKLMSENYPSFELWKKNKRKYSHSIYQDSERFSVYSFRNYGKPSIQINRYDSLGGKKKRYLAERIYLSNNKIASRTVYFRNDTGRIDSTLYYQEKKTIPYYKTEYSYKNNKLAETRNYKKGKLKYVRKYDCTPLGEVQKKITKSSVCTNTEFDKEGNKIVVREFTNQKGEVTKTKLTYKGNSKIIIKNESFDSKNRPTYYYEENDSKIVQINYRKKGKERYKSIQYLNQEGNVIKKETFWKGKSQGVRLYEFDEKGKKVKEMNFSGKKKLTSTSTFEYNKMGLLTKKIKTGKKKTTTKVIEYF